MCESCDGCHLLICSPSCPGAPAPVPVGKCPICGDDIMAGDYCYAINGAIYHGDCVRDNAFDILMDEFHIAPVEADSYSGFRYI